MKDRTSTMSCIAVGQVSISKLPVEMKKKDIFYCKPKTSAPTDPTTPWFCSVPWQVKQALIVRFQTIAYEHMVLRSYSKRTFRRRL